MADIEAARRFLAAEFESAGLPHTAGSILAGISPFGKGAYIAAVAAALKASTPPLAPGERARFEAWAHAQSYGGGNIISDPHPDYPEVYACPLAQLAWCCWQAALAIGPRRDERFVSGLCNRLETLSATAQRMAEGGNSDLPVVGLHHAQQMVRKANAAGRPALDLHRLIPPLWLSEQIGGPLDDLTPGQAWRNGFNECRTRMQLLVDQIIDLHKLEVSQ
ncbi:hypothetical protein H3005_14155 [Stenotrophomonas sp. Br8]|uniref:hypothetical protein n=1 Tax=Stenotrophomonas sp. Br8 TaxID=2759658 RepID=UPI00168A6F95|nr:hypothetical protein [Stenotrophomonas sp. Br8]MBD3683008.1 hypothetical protein [Stenotrophomonas sp. Br8]